MHLPLTRHAALALSLLFAAAGCKPGAPAAPADATRIMLLGDSITQGARGRDSWRRELWFKLGDAGFAVNFVGGQSSNYRGAGANSDFDPDHEGHWGWQANQVLDKIDGWVASHPPDVVLLHIGTNDIGRGESIEATVAEVRAVIEAIRAQNPQVVVLLAQIIPLGGGEVNRRIGQFNGELAQMAEAASTAASRIVVVDQFGGFDAAADTYDGVHPNDAGNSKMAGRWFAALANVLGRDSL